MDSHQDSLNVISTTFKDITATNSFETVLEFAIKISIAILLFFLIYFLINIGNKYVDKDQRIYIHKKKLVYGFLWISLIVLIFMFFKAGTHMYDIISPFIYAIILAYILNPLVLYIENKGIKKIWAVIIMYVFVIGIIVLFSFTLLPKMTLEIRKLIESIPQLGEGNFGEIYHKYILYNESIDNLPAEFDGLKQVLKFDGDQMQDVIMKIFKYATNSMVSIFSKLINVILIPIITFYLLKDSEKFKSFIVLTIPKRVRKEVLSLASDMDGVVGGFIRGQVLVAAIVGIMTTIALILLGVDFAIVVGMIAGVSDVIPYLGPIIGIVPAIIFASLDGLNKVIWVIIIFFIIQQLESAVISPKIISDKVGLHPIMIMLVLIIGGKFGGFLGILFAVPLAGAIKVLCKHVINYIAKF